ncbi:hypothetical protein [Dongia rigui]|uniref:Uncharacterized protein n=1 Tax=Dongia rigui TaxID=940149 RepID=A0ABU5E4S5_9PROT|nr:hypothetical protein [Dongia rigui]MDY0873933.1 hypothetical protein [Dongia rigui]
MTDEVQILTGSLQQVGIIIGAVAALGAAAQGLVDVTKGVWIRSDAVGFFFVKDALQPFDAALSTALGQGQVWQKVLWAHWLNGRDTADQKGIAKALIKLGLSPRNSADVAKALAIDAKAFADTIDALNQGAALTEVQLNILGRFDATIDARLDAAYERADRRYRSTARNIGAGIAVLLAVFAGAFLYADACAAAAGNAADASNMAGGVCAAGSSLAFGDLLWGYLGSRYFPLSILIGLIAVPLAPVSKDLVSAIGAAARAVKSVKE